MYSNQKPAEIGDALKALPFSLEEEVDTETEVEEPKLIPIEVSDQETELQYEHNVFKIYAYQVNKIVRMDFAAEIECIHKAQAGDIAARNKMVESNLKLVMKLANKYRGSKTHLLDLIEEGNLGLMHAIEKFDPSLGFKFSTYASYWIRQRMQLALHSSRSVRLPVHIQKKIMHLGKISAKCAQDLQHPAACTELAKASGFSEEEIADLQTFIEPFISLDSKLSDDREHTLLDLFGSHAYNPSEVAQNEELRDCIQQQVHTLKLQYREVLTLRFGLDGEQAHSLEATAQLLGVSREKVRACQNRALEIIKDRLRKQGISSYPL